ncbi:6-phosphofructokinase [Desulfoferrobacter suflitae]|uniref:6-phosphofructokinase n=1 Tax=Desulfoferrobacter suflitae TaxID=2865782 RepID=UPI0021644BC1|nr:6-phosphofructokinase [Desulfoferrobacter suflitae]MCK8603380.1 6-phosphofructokinase [Desulfoferrobacter suflitae]
MLKTLAVMTSGGDSPGMNAAIRAVVRRALDGGLTVYGVRDGYEGLVQGGDAIRPLEWKDVGGILAKGGTFLGTARCQEFKSRPGRRQAVGNLLEHRIEALVVIGGDGSLMGAHILATEWLEHLQELNGLAAQTGAEPFPDYTLQVVGLPGSIDNDLYGTDMCIGADTALNHIVRALDDLSSTAASHQRTFVVETMGRHCGYLALASALAGGASWVLLPEEELDPRWHQKMTGAIENERKVGRPHHMVVVAEGTRHLDGLPIHTEEIKEILTRRLGIDVRVTVLGHVQRGGTPTAFDRNLATRLGVAAVDILIKNPTTSHRHMVGLIRNNITATPLVEVVEKSRAVGEQLELGNYEKARELRGETFSKTLELVKTLTRITPAQEKHMDGAVAILTGGADGPGMNAAVSVAARCLLNQGISVVGVKDAFLGLIRDNLVELNWNDLVGWLNRPASEIGTARFDFLSEHFAAIAQNLKRHNIRGIIAIGGWGTYAKVAELIERRPRFDAFNIPMILVPATIDNNLPCTEASIGADTALNTIVEAVDRIRHTAGATHRVFIVEIMGRDCGFLALMGALASGAEKAYLPENGISLAELSGDMESLRKAFASGKRMVIYLRNENSSDFYTTDFIRRVVQAESNNEFEVRTAVLGHIQRGGVPMAFDRILACRMGAAAAFTIAECMQNASSDVQAVGLRGRGVETRPFSEALREMDVQRGRPKDQWFLQLVEVADALAKYAPFNHPGQQSAKPRMRSSA